MIAERQHTICEPVIMTQWLTFSFRIAFNFGFGRHFLTVSLKDGISFAKVMSRSFYFLPFNYPLLSLQSSYQCSFYCIAFLLSESFKSQPRLWALCWCHGSLQTKSANPSFVAHLVTAGSANYWTLWKSACLDKSRSYSMDPHGFCNFIIAERNRLSERETTETFPTGQLKERSVPIQSMELDDHVLYENEI